MRCQRQERPAIRLPAARVRRRACSCARRRRSPSPLARSV
jgi:hypothetical protein